MNQHTFTDAIADYFKARPNQWIDGNELATVGGCYAWRSRVSNARTRYGLTIENRQRRVGRRVISEYRLVPADLLELAS